MGEGVEMILCGDLILDALKCSGGSSGTSIADVIHEMPTIYSGALGKSYHYLMKFGYFSEKMNQLMGQSWNVNYDITTTGQHVENYTFTTWEYYYKLFFEIYRNEQSTPDFITYANTSKFYTYVDKNDYSQKIGDRDIGGLPKVEHDISSIVASVSRVKTDYGNGYTYTINLNGNTKTINYVYYEDQSKDYTYEQTVTLKETLTLTNFQNFTDVILNSSVEQYQNDIADIFYQIQKFD